MEVTLARLRPVHKCTEVSCPPKHSLCRSHTNSEREEQLGVANREVETEAYKIVRKALLLYGSSGYTYLQNRIDKAEEAGFIHLHDLLLQSRDLLVEKGFLDRRSESLHEHEKKVALRSFYAQLNKQGKYHATRDGPLKVPRAGAGPLITDAYDDFAWETVATADRRLGYESHVEWAPESIREIYSRAKKASLWYASETL